MGDPFTKILNGQIERKWNKSFGPEALTSSVTLRQRCVKDKTAPVKVRGSQLKQTNLCHERNSQRPTSTSSVTS